MIRALILALGMLLASVVAQAQNAVTYPTGSTSQTIGGTDALGATSQAIGKIIQLRDQPPPQPAGTLNGNLTTAAGASGSYSPPQVSAAGFTGNSICGLSQNLVSTNIETGSGGGFGTTGLQLYNVQWIVLCQEVDNTSGVGPVPSSQAILIRNIYPINVSYNHTVATLDKWGVSTPTTQGGNDPGAPCGGRGTPTDCYLFAVATATPAPSYGSDDFRWGVVLSANGCAQGPSPSVRNLYPFYGCLMWNRTAGASSIGADYFKFIDAQYQHHHEHIGYATSQASIVYDYPTLRSGSTGGAWAGMNPGDPAGDPSTFGGSTADGNLASYGVEILNTTPNTLCAIGGSSYSNTSTALGNSGNNGSLGQEFRVYPAPGGAWASNSPTCEIKLKWWDDIYP